MDTNERILTFDVGKHHLKFKVLNFSGNTLSSCALVKCWPSSSANLRRNGSLARSNSCVPWMVLFKHHVWHVHSCIKHSNNNRDNDDVDDDDDDNMVTGTVV